MNDPTTFMEQTIGHNESWVMTAPIQIKNGNVVREGLTYTFHPEDYERRSLIKIEGETIFIRNQAAQAVRPYAYASGALHAVRRS